MSNAKPFQIIIVFACIFIALVAVLVFSFGGSKKDSEGDFGPQVIIWGTAPAGPINEVITEMNTANEGSVNAFYEEVDELTFSQTLLEALAVNQGPDAILISAENVLKESNKIFPIPFENINERSFRDSYIEEGELFVTDGGYFALPFSVDPMVLYWNRDIFTAQNEPAPPAYWDNIIPLISKLSVVSPDFAITRSAIGLGDFRNIKHAREIMSTLIFQAGSPITRYDYEGIKEKHVLTLDSPSSLADHAGLPLETSLAFYAQFANPSVSQYTWNRSLPNSFDMFIKGDLAMYAGFGSEKDLIREKNPNLNFDMAFFPQSRSSAVPRTYGKMHGLAILNSSANIEGAYKAVTAMTGKEFLQLYVAKSGLPPVRRDLLAEVPPDAFSPILYKSSLYAQGWIDPDSSKTEAVFKLMIESVLAGTQMPSDAATVARQSLELLIDAVNKKNNAK